MALTSRPPPAPADYGYTADPDERTQPGGPVALAVRAAFEMYLPRIVGEVTASICNVMLEKDRARTWREKRFRLALKTLKAEVIVIRERLDELEKGRVA